jgi:hypothetical protein
LLGDPNIETPAEIDGLLDDYFEANDEFLAMASNNDAGGDESQQSAPSNGESTRQTQPLFPDLQTARDYILNSSTALHLPNTTVPQGPNPAAATTSSVEREPDSGVVPAGAPAQGPPPAAATMPNFVREPDSGVGPPGAALLQRSNTNPYRRGLTSLGRSIGVNTGDGNRDLAEEGRSTQYTGGHTHDNFASTTLH